MRAATTIALLILVVIILAAGCSGSATSANYSAEEVYKMHCAICHGDDGRKGFGGAKPLPESTLGVEERIHVITKGRGSMMPYADVLKPEEIKAVAEYTTTLK